MAGAPKNQFEVPALLLGPGPGFGPGVWMPFEATQDLKASSKHQSGKLVVSLFFPFIFLLNPFNYSRFL